jgi:hypothetical protein
MMCLNLGSVRISGFYCLAELAKAHKIQVFKGTVQRDELG